MAKRNFRNRHNHGMTEVTDAADGDETHNAAKATAKVTSGSSSSDGSSAGDNSGNNLDNGNNKRTAAQALGEEPSAIAPSADLTIPNKLARLNQRVGQAGSEGFNIQDSTLSEQENEKNFENIHSQKGEDSHDKIEVKNEPTRKLKKLRKVTNNDSNSD